MELFDEHIQPSDKNIKELKAILEKQHGREFTWEEATKATRDMMTFGRLALEVAEEEFRRKKLLEESPKGYHYDRSGYSCRICDGSASGEDSWYDKYGLKCMTCQKAINEKIIPGSVAQKKESWYSKYDLESYFNIKGAFLNKYLKQGILKDRLISGDGKKAHLQLFLIKDNKDFLPPKKLLQSRTVKVMWKGEEYYTSEYWYEFIDIELAKKLAKFKIFECLKETFMQPIKRGRFYYKEINPLFTHKR